MPIPPEDSLVVRGAKLAIWYAVKSNGRMLAKQFYGDRSVGDRAKFMTLFASFSRDGHIQNDTKFKWFGDGIGEFKIDGWRILCFRHKGDICLTHGCSKLPKKEFQNEIVRAMNIRREHCSRFD